MTSSFERYAAATARLDGFIEHANAPENKSLEAVRERAEFRMGRLRSFLEVLGNPQEQYPIVHVGGTSGKGSTSTTIAAIATASGYRTGLHTSPYLQTPLEKLQIDGQLLGPDRFADLVEELLITHERWVQAGQESLTYGELWVALTLQVFASEKVDLAVIEVGAGGRFDLTNVVMPVLSVITSVGIDHTQTLGSTIEAIAWHKAGIIKPGVPAVTAATHPAALEIIRQEAAVRESALTIIPEAIEVQQTGPDGTTWLDPTTGRMQTIALGGTFQARNGATAVAAATILAGRGWKITADTIAAGLLAARIPGRIELVRDRVPVLLDGAHNPEKIAALAHDIPQLLAHGPSGRRIAVLGVLEAKQADDMFRQLIPVVDEIVATSPQVLAKASKNASDIAEIARRAGFHGRVTVEPEPKAAMAIALDAVQDEAEDAILVTGSLYLIGNIRERWFHERDIVLQRTPWPVSLVDASAGSGQSE